MSKKVASIDEIITNKWLVEFDRKPLDKHPMYGFIVNFNEEFTLVHRFDRDLFILDGYCVFPNTTVKKYAVYDDESYFLNEVIQAKKIVPKALPKVSISSWPEIVKSVSEFFPLLVVGTERLHKNECYIGKVTEIKQKSFKQQEMDTDAVWYGVTKYKFKDVTMISFGGLYESTLALVNAYRDRIEMGKVRECRVQ